MPHSDKSLPVVVVAFAVVNIVAGLVAVFVVLDWSENSLENEQALTERRFTSKHEETNKNISEQLCGWACENDAGMLMYAS